MLSDIQLFDRFTGSVAGGRYDTGGIIEKVYQDCCQQLVESRNKATLLSP